MNIGVRLMNAGVRLFNTDISTQVQPSHSTRRSTSAQAARPIAPPHAHARHSCQIVSIIIVANQGKHFVFIAMMERLRQAADQTKVTVKMPAKLVGMYGDFITKNAGAVGQVEGALRSLTYIIPGVYTIITLGSPQHTMDIDPINRPLQRVRIGIRIPQLGRPTPSPIP